jgi:outer membrane protein assembly factor BamB
MIGSVLALNPVTGAERWEFEPQSVQTGSIGSGNLTSIKNAFLSCSQGGAGSFRAGYFYGAPVVANGMIYVAYFSGVVYAIDAASGQQAWNYDLKSHIAGGLAVAGGTVLVGSSNGNISALDAGNGTLKWEFSSKDEIWGAPAVADGVVYFGSLDHSLYALNATDGKEKWEFRTEGGIGSTPLVVGGVVYVGSFDHKFYAIDGETGAQKWVFEGSRDWFWCAATYDDGTIYAASLDNNVYALEAGNGTVAWPQPFKASNRVKSSPIIVSGLLVVASENGNVYGLDPKTGKKEWEFDGIKAKVLSPLYSAEGIVYINSQDNKLHALNGENGFEFWGLPLGS